MSASYAIVTISGFGSDELADTGLWRLHRRLEQKFFDRREAVVLHLRWSSCAVEVARIVDGALGPCPTIFAIAHSYGAGVFIPKFSAALKDRGRCLDVAYLIDQVPRFWKRTILPWNLWKHLRGRDKLRLPDNLYEAYLTWQVNDFPRGRDVVHDDDRVRDRRCYGTPANLKRFAGDLHDLDKRVWHGASHEAIDNYPRLHDVIESSIEKRIFRFKTGLPAHMEFDR